MDLKYIQICYNCKNQQKIDKMMKAIISHNKY